MGIKSVPFQSPRWCDRHNPCCRHSYLGSWGRQWYQKFRKMHHHNLKYIAWWRHQMETFSALLAICAGNSPGPGEIPAQRSVTRSFDVFFDLRLNKRLNKQSWGWWLETLSRPLWRHSNALSPPPRPPLPTTADNRIRMSNCLLSFCRSVAICPSFSCSRLILFSVYI